jgi:two-component system, sensor histidine kinase and response regulator
MDNRKAGTRERILVVDDDELNLSILEEILGDEYSLRRASDGAAALAEARRFRPGLILLDVMMPGLNGYETCRSIRQIPDLRFSKVLLVSAKAMVSDRLKGYESGADDYITKPFDHDELLAKVRVFLRLKSAEEMDRLQSDFLTVLGHQFRTPLTHVLGAADLLSSDTSMAPDARHRMVQAIVCGARKMEWLLDYVNHFHEVRVGSIAAATHSVPLLDVTAGAVRDLAVTAEMKRVRLAFATRANADTFVDRYHLGFVLRTLLGEAIAASPEGGTVLVSMANEGNAAVVTVTGRREVGDSAHPEQVFDLFWVEDLPHHHGEISCLPLAREISRRYGGDLELRASAPGETTLALRVPVVEVVTAGGGR